MKYRIVSLIIGTLGGLLMAGDAARASAPDGETMFRKVKELLQKDYYRADIDESALYRAAVRGMLQYADEKMAPWNRLLDAQEYGELKSDLRGEIVGVGVHFDFDPETGYARVLSVVPDSPAATAGLKAGDRILNVDGKFYKGKTLRDVAYAIRGRAGESRKLTVLREDKVLTRTVRLTTVNYAVVEGGMMPGEVGRVKIRYFSETTPESLRKVLRELTAKKARALVIDLRGNEGGMLHPAMESISLFLPPETPVMTLHKRGGKVETMKTSGSPLVAGVPVTVLVDGATASGAEVFAAALHESAGAPLIGAPTKGKASAQNLEELADGYAVKYTIATFTTAQGLDYAGKGLEPDVRVAAAEGSDDPALRAALELLAQRR